MLAPKGGNTDFPVFPLFFMVPQPFSWCYHKCAPQKLCDHLRGHFLHSSPIKYLQKALSPVLSHGKRYTNWWDLFTGHSEQRENRRITRRRWNALSDRQSRRQNKQYHTGRQPAHEFDRYPGSPPSRNVIDPQGYGRSGRSGLAGSNNDRRPPNLPV